MMEKICSRCFILKGLDSFQKRKASKDGFTSACKECLSAYDKSRANLPHRVKQRYEYAKTPAGIAASNKAKKKWQENNICKRASHIIVGNAIHSGKLVKKPCEICGKKKVHAHHDDYSKALDIRWLCDKHHNEWHRDNGEGKNP